MKKFLNIVSLRVISNWMKKIGPVVAFRGKF